MTLPAIALAQVQSGEPRSGVRSGEPRSGLRRAEPPSGVRGAEPLNGVPSAEQRRLQPGSGLAVPGVGTGSGASGSVDQFISTTGQFTPNTPFRPNTPNTPNTPFTPNSGGR